MSGNCLKRADGLAPLTRLTFLCLAFNEILSLAGLSVLRSLVTLDVSHNHVSTLRGLDNLSALTSLNASHNALAAPEEINLLRRCDDAITFQCSWNSVETVLAVTCLFFCTGGACLILRLQDVPNLVVNMLFCL